MASCFDSPTREVELEPDLIFSQIDKVFVVLDTSIVFDPKTYEETIVANRFEYSLEEYLKEELNIKEPKTILDGKEHLIRDQYQNRMIHLRWNPQKMTLDTIGFSAVR